jgi:hypothetical protein
MSNLPYCMTMRKNDANMYMFPGKLHNMMECIEQEGLESILSWVLDGRGFMIHDEKQLVGVLPKIFSQTKYRSFRRQLNMWHFQRVLEGPFKGAFIHPCFLKGKKELCSYMSRQLSFNPVEFEASIAKEKFHILRDQQSKKSTFREDDMILSNLLLQSFLQEPSEKTYSSETLKSHSFALRSTMEIINELSSEIHDCASQRIDQVFPDPHDGDMVSFAGKKFFFLECKDKSLRQSPPLHTRKLTESLEDFRNAIIKSPAKLLETDNMMYEPKSIFRL